MSSTDDFKEEDLPHEVQVEIAYEVAKGNAFKKYSQHDFKLGGRSEIVQRSFRSRESNYSKTQYYGA